VFGAHIGWSAVVTSIVFGLWHGLDVSAHFKISVEVAPMVIPSLGGFVLAWCRARSGSLILPIVAHSGMNEVANLIALVKNA
jgi:membrane protease YdiL (CAAX protease family)